MRRDSAVDTPEAYPMRIEPTDVMVFDDDGKVMAMKAYWSAADVTQLRPG
jgi:steroid Delta-isomerase